MIQRITVRLDEGLTNLIASIKEKDIYNLSALTREALRDRLMRILINIDNSGQTEELKKDENIWVP